MAEVLAGSSEVRATATEILRRMLDERGVGTYKHEVPEAVCLAYFDGARWHDCWESTGGEVNVTFSMTPEQAIAATLGRTCHDTGESRVFRCSECGFGLEDAYVEDEHAYPTDGFPKFCPWCGAEVVRK